MKQMLINLFLPSVAAMLLLACNTTGPVQSDVWQPPSSALEPGTDTGKRAKVHTELGSLYLLDGRHAVALEEARIALNIDPNYAPAYNLLGLTHMSLSETRPAEENFERALKIAGGDPEINNNYGWFLCQSGREQRSIAYFLSAAKNPHYQAPTRAYTNAGICSIKLKDDKSAETYLTTAIRLMPENTLAMYWLADLQYRTGRLTDARQTVADIDKLIEPTAEVTWLTLRIERKLGNREAEARMAAQLRRRFSNSPEHRSFAQGQYE